MNIEQIEVLFHDGVREVRTYFEINTKDKNVFEDVHKIIELTPFENEVDRDQVTLSILKKGELILHPKDARDVDLEIVSSQVFSEDGSPVGTRTRVIVINS